MCPDCEREAAEREAAAVKAAREECARVCEDERYILESPPDQYEQQVNGFLEGAASAIRALNTSGALDHAIENAVDEARSADAEIWRKRIDRKVNEARVDEATWWEANLAKEVHDAHCANQDGYECICCKRIAELKAALESK